MSNTEQIRTASGLNLIAGIWLLLSSFLLGVGNAAMSSNLFVVGLIVAIVALIRVSMPMTTGGLSWLNFILGIWLIISAFVMGGLTATIFWNSLILGIVVAALAYWSMSSSQKLQTR